MIGSSKFVEFKQHPLRFQKMRDFRKKEVFVDLRTRSWNWWFINSAQLAAVGQKERVICMYVSLSFRDWFKASHVM